MKDLYLERKKQIEKDLNEFPIVYAFSEEQLTKGLEKLGATKEEVVRIPSGGIMKKTDVQSFKDMLKRWDVAHKEGLKIQSYVYQMFRYELANHEYCITYDLEDTLEACELTEEEVKNNPLIKHELSKAMKDYLDNVVTW